MLRYAFSWLPVVAVTSVLVLFNAWLALLAFALMAVLTLALVVALIGLAGAKVYASASRHARAHLSRTTDARSGRAQRQHRDRLSV
jgi:hypothetical protein